MSNTEVLTILATCRKCFDNSSVITVCKETLLFLSSISNLYFIGQVWLFVFSNLSSHSLIWYLQVKDLVNSLSFNYFNLLNNPAVQSWEKSVVAKFVITYRFGCSLPFIIFNQADKVKSTCCLGITIAEQMPLGHSLYKIIMQPFGHFCMEVA